MRWNLVFGPVLFPELSPQEPPLRRPADWFSILADVTKFSTRNVRMAVEVGAVLYGRFDKIDQLAGCREKPVLSVGSIGLDRLLDVTDRVVAKVVQHVLNERFCLAR